MKSRWSFERLIIVCYTIFRSSLSSRPPPVISTDQGVVLEAGEWRNLVFHTIEKERCEISPLVPHQNHLNSVEMTEVGLNNRL